MSNKDSLEVGYPPELVIQLIKDYEEYVPWYFGKMHNMSDDQILLILEDYKDFIPWQFGKDGFDADTARELFKLLDL